MEGKEIVRSSDNLPSLLGAAQVELIKAPTPAAEVKQRVGRGGQTFKYVSTNYVRDTLNKVFGYQWSFETENVGPWELVSKTGQIIVKGKLTMSLLNGDKIVKEQYGSAEVKMFKGNSGPVDVADDFKAAASDALKKCASLLGIAADVYASGPVQGTAQAPQQGGSKQIQPGEWQNKPASEKQKAFISSLLTKREIPADDFKAFCYDHFGLMDKGDNAPEIPTGLTSGQVDGCLAWIREYEAAPAEKA